MMMALGGMPEERSNAPFMSSASRVSNAVTRSPSHESGATNHAVLYYSYSVYSITHSPQNVSSDLPYTNYQSRGLIECNHQT